MNNVHAVTLRALGSCLHSAPWLRPSQFLRCTVRPSRNCSTITASRERFSPRYGSSIRDVTQSSFWTSQTRSFQSSTATCALKPANSSSSPKVEQGLSFRDTLLSPKELRNVYGEVVPPSQVANRLLRVLHGRRVDGTLDLPLPRDLQATLQRYPYAAESALYWLRTKYYVDEDEAIMARIDREEAGSDVDSPSELTQRGQNIGLYGTQNQRPEGAEMAQPSNTVKDEPQYYGPQSGQFRAPLSEKEGDVFGQSELDRIRAANEAEAAKEEEELEKQIAQIQAKEVKARSQDTALASRPEQGVEASEAEVRPPNEFEKWILRAKNKSTSKLTLDSPEIQDKSKARRLIPSFVFVVGVCTGLYFFAQTWVPPKRSERLWPDMTMSFATVAGILAVNLGVLFLWRFPPAWPLLNRYFLVVPATVKPMSHLGSIFSHTRFKHLFGNAVALVVFGPSLHEDLGRADFLAVFIGSGVIGSYISMARYVSQGVLITSSLGASGAVWGVTAAFLNLHANDKFTAFFLPQDMKQDYSIRGWMFFAGLVAFELVGIFTGKLKRVNVDYMAHLGGAGVGWVFGHVWKRNKAAEQHKGQYVPKPTRAWWQFLRGGAGDR